MKRRIIVVFFVICCIIVNVSFAEQSQHRADEYFNSGSAKLYASKIVGIIAKTEFVVDRISADYCKLYKLVGSSWQLVSTIYPTYYVTNDWQFGTQVDFSSFIDSGTYKVEVRFNADGHTLTKYSNSRVF